MSADTAQKYFFKNRDDAAEQLFAVLPSETFQKKESIVVGLSEGGVLIADRLARLLECRMDILLTESILAPNNPELPIAKVSETEEMVIHKALTDAFEIETDHIYSEAKRVYDEKILAYLYKYRKGTPIQSVENKVVILVDECVETGITTLVAIKSMIALGAKNVYVATPVLDESVYESLAQISDGVFCPHRFHDYISIEYYYRDLHKPTHEQIERILEQYE